jgi:hypothetical protein
LVLEALSSDFFTAWYSGGLQQRPCRPMTRSSPPDSAHRRIVVVLVHRSAADGVVSRAQIS